MLVDIHSHLDHCYFEKDIEGVIGNARKNNVKAILTAGINPETNRKALQLAEKYDIVKACLGIYPVQVLKKEIEEDHIPFENSPFDIDEEIRFIEKNKDKIAAVSEIGLDYYWVKDKVKEQKDLFEKMLALAEKVNKPIIVHSRKAEQDTIEMIQSTKLKEVVMHCFCGKKALVKKIIDNNWFLTAPTSITRSTQFQENTKLCPITQLFVETDAPYLSPYKDKRNEPAFIVESYKKIAEIKGMELQEVINNLWMSWQRISR
ncbi:TatD family hydrolase [Candidatus Woesearchaeota archaeon]|nr:TatD family hydrolase [Candidatus Woesearchaeota archaeon]